MFMVIGLIDWFCYFHSDRKNPSEINLRGVLYYETPLAIARRVAVRAAALEKYEQLNISVGARIGNSHFVIPTWSW
jgi:hypothetical protein